MAERGDPQVLKHVVAFLRTRAGMTQEKIARKLGTTQAHMSAYELGNMAPSEDVLRGMAPLAGVPWYVVQHLTRFLTAALEAARRGTEAGVAPIDLSVLDTVLLAVMPYLVEEEMASARLPAEETLREAGEIWAALEPLPAQERWRRIETAPLGSCRDWAALAKTVCEASARSAADSAEEARELAELALLIAGHVPDEERAQATAYGWGYMANARRVANDFDGAGADFVRARKLWPGSDSGLFPEWRLLDLEASLRRAQHRWPEALALLDEARARSGGDRLAAARILLKKEHVLQQMGDAEGALRVLEEASPLVESLKDPHLLFALRFNQADNLARLERYEEAARLLPDICAAAAEQAKGLDSIRVVWLAAKVKAGTGQKEGAMADLEKVRDAFTAEELPYDGALADLDLAALRLEAGRTAEVREQTENMAWIFVSKKIDREALAALKLFCDAAKLEAATVELARRVIAEVEKARRSGPPPVK
ncbi:MAG TPA: helix-turn-helix transcriptional regulator [Thermoanaerobaculia bacterium]|jgi:transcriptional regulator with XRE-family HTH domain|nr:helix-turn-helix transcriptional regulator [Thermoanaerobaculia bacterium]